MPEAGVLISRLNTHCELVADTERAEMLARHLTAGLAQRLPEALRNELGSDLDHSDAVIRLAEIELATQMGDRLDPSALASDLARQLSAVIRDALRGEPHKAQIWPDRMSYLASYIDHRLGLSDDPAWAFEEFGALSHLPPERAAAELIVAKPELLIALSRKGTRVGAPARLAERLAEPQLVALLNKLSQSAASAILDRQTLKKALEHVRQNESQTSQKSFTATPARACAALMLRALASSEAVGVLPTLLASARLVLARITASAAEFEQVGESSQHIDQASRSQGTHASGPALAAFLKRSREAFEGLALDEDIKASARPTERSHEGRRPDAQLTQTDEDDNPEQGAVRAPDEALQTRFAGLALLAAPINALSLHHWLSPEALARAVWQTLPDDHTEAVSEDAAIGTLFPFDPRAMTNVEFPAEIPDSLIAPLHRDARATFEAHAERAPWSALILAAFASRLTGLQASSPRYLCDQFLMRSGHIKRTNTLIEVSLDKVELAIILQMAGLTGTAWLAPHLGRSSILITVEGRV